MFLLILKLIHKWCKNRLHQSRFQCFGRNTKGDFTWETHIWWFVTHEQIYLSILLSFHLVEISGYHTVQIGRIKTSKINIKNVYFEHQNGFNIKTFGDCELHLDRPSAILLLMCSVYNQRRHSIVSFYFENFLAIRISNPKQRREITSPL